MIEQIRIIVYAAVAAFFVAAAVGWFIALFFVYGRRKDEKQTLREIIHGEFFTVVALPMAAIASFIVVWALTITSGPIVFEAFGFKFQGAAGPALFWVIVFLAIVLAIRLLKNRGKRGSPGS